MRNLLQNQILNNQLLKENLSPEVRWQAVGSMRLSIRNLVQMVSALFNDFVSILAACYLPMVGENMFLPTK
jgi:hypothetical protein